MECREAYRWLCAYLDGELDSERAESIQKHLELCALCRRELELQQVVKTLVQEQFLNVAAPDYLRERVIAELERVEEYRESGIQALDLVRWGTHAAQLYNSKNELAEVLVPYMGKGLEQNELCVWVTWDISQEEAKEALAEEIPGLQTYIDKCQLQLFSYEDWYLPGGCFDMQCVLNNAAEKYQEALSNGYSGLRMTGNGSWVKQSDWDSLMEYENFVNSIVCDYKLLLMCAYKESKCSIDNIVDVMSTHKYVISKIDDSWRLRRSAEI